MLGPIAERLRTWLDFEQDLLVRSIRAAAPFARGRLLDVGCGDKPYAPIFRTYVDAHVGIDRRETFGSSVNAARVKPDYLYDGDGLPFGDGEFDTVLCTQVLEHVRSPEVFFSELARVLRPGGCLIATVPFSHRIHSAPEDYHRFTRFALEDLAARARLDVEMMADRGGLWTVVGQKITSHLVTKVARLKRPIQELGGYGYEGQVAEAARWWTLPLVGPAVVGAVLLARLLDRIDPDPTETLGYTMVAKKRPPPSS